MTSQLRYVLMQVRKPDDPMRGQEVGCFARALHGSEDQITTWDILDTVPGEPELRHFDVALFGGSGDYSATSEEAWIEPILDLMRELHREAKPTFASCWGFQAMARALGGSVVHDLSRAELGTNKLHLTEAGRQDPVFGPLAPIFHAQMGHADRVDRLPEDAVLLASTEKVANQAYRFRDKPIYCTQFHPELNRDNLLGRLRQYPEYVDKIAGIPFDQFEATVHDTPETEQLLRRFLDTVFA
ncbi:MAG: type 1 glutamine amidotransferase [Planctomycetota bacterium]|nr:MAG: type 1 glutamine amidotransferase [Planctomycetota bacterium]REJ93284.1 MAG: type 1 glutamine amidotransferase [Planctomycetota bacterium]REK30197.1 MAG: type 1 glutamine amidotransferase [Planctomycetota bacterium]REK49265.1 MAG: type 1 glutamine amidotransferase [Planctomycetota bacterium]